MVVAVFTSRQGEASMTQEAHAQSFQIPSFNHSLVEFDAERRALWHYLSPAPRPVFTREILSEILNLQEKLRTHLASGGDTDPNIRYMVTTSTLPGVFSLGGDLELFAELIRTRNREGLVRYGELCIRCIHNSTTNLDHPQLTTIALAQGSALGGGFEAALSANYLVAERSAQMGFPEILFNLFPGMGAYNLLARRLDPARAERFLRSGRQYTAAELYDMGIVDVLAEDGEGVHAVNAFIRRHQRSSNGLLAIQQVRQRLNPIPFRDLEDVVAIWVEAALNLTERDLRTMERLVSAQHRMARRSDDMGHEHAPAANLVPLAGVA
jgi:DSF synthase